MHVHFNLRSTRASFTTAIMLVVHYQGERLRVTSKERILVAAWDFENQCALLGENTLEHTALNKRLASIQQAVKIYLENKEKSGGNVRLSELKQHITQFIDQAKNTKTSAFFWDTFDTFVRYKKTSIKSYKTYDQELRKHLQNVENISQQQLTFEAFHYHENSVVNTLKNYFTYYAQNRKGEAGLLTNTIWKQFKNLKVFLNWCVDQGLIQNFSTKHLTAPLEHIAHVFLTEEELARLENLNLSTSERIVRDLFLVSCETGLRFSDVCSLPSQAVKEDCLEVYPKKTRKHGHTNRLIIPFSTRVKRILARNGQQLPTYPYSQINNFNTCLRALCERADICAINYYYRTIQDREVRIEQKKFELISSHTGRRTFCTLKFLAGMPSHVIMKFSGHTSEQNFMRYLKIDAEIAATKYRDFF